MAQTTVNCLPVYVVIDTSGSMIKFEDQLNESIVSIYEELIGNPRISDFAQVSIISFATEPSVILQMTELQKLTALPRVACDGVTMLDKALRLIRAQIEEDVPALKTAGHQVLRPAVFLLTDGMPSDDQGYASTAWEADYAQLTDSGYPYHPNVVPFGYGQATPEFLAQVATIRGAAFLAKDGPGSALQQVIPALLNTLVKSAANKGLTLPNEVDGFTRITDEYI